jgi:hypothetical protein
VGFVFHVTMPAVFLLIRILFLDGQIKFLSSASSHSAPSTPPFCVPMEALLVSIISKTTAVPLAVVKLFQQQAVSFPTQRWWMSSLELFTSSSSCPSIPADGAERKLFFRSSRLGVEKDRDKEEDFTPKKGVRCRLTSPLFP